MALRASDAKETSHQLQRDVIAVPAGMVQLRVKEQEVPVHRGEGSACGAGPLVVDDDEGVGDRAPALGRNGREAQIEGRSGNVDAALHHQPAHGLRGAGDLQRAAQDIIAQDRLPAQAVARSVDAPGRRW